MRLLLRYVLPLGIIAALAAPATGQPIRVNGQQARLAIRQVTPRALRITLTPRGYKNDFPYSPAISAGLSSGPALIDLRAFSSPIQKKMGSLLVKLSNDPLTITITNAQGRQVQSLVFDSAGVVHFATGDRPILGMGEGGPQPPRGADWHTLPVQYDRRGAIDSMQPRWQGNAYGSRNPVAMLAGTGGWGLFAVTPWMLVDLRDRQEGLLIPRKLAAADSIPQNEKDQDLQTSKGLPPVENSAPGLYDLFVFDAGEPALLMKDFATITGPAVLPPKWALGYMQSHRTLRDEEQMKGVVDTFRSKKIPLDAVIYLGTGFAPQGWNTPQPSFRPHPAVFKNGDIGPFITEMHNRNVKVVLHMVPWDRDSLPTLEGSIPAQRGEALRPGHIQPYWQQHETLVKKGVDAFWPDEGDWFNLHERIKRHQLYYQGSLFTEPQKRPWSLQRNGYPGIAQWGGWVWSGDTESSWKTLEAQIAVGLNYSLSIGPYWGSDIGGFYSSNETTGELYARWFQFGSFCGSFRSHGRTWRTRLPWGWGQSSMDPIEDRRPPPADALNDARIEPIVKQYDELRYRLLPYTYTLAWEARSGGLPLMRALWLQYPHDTVAAAIGSQYLWGRDLLIAPVFEKGATARKLYLPAGDWYDWWTEEKLPGAQFISKAVDLSVMPIYVRAGAVIPLDTVRQYAAEPVSTPTTLQVYTGANGSFTLYDDDGQGQDYLQRKGNWIHLQWNDREKTLTLKPGAPPGFTDVPVKRNFRIRLAPSGEMKECRYDGRPLTLHFK